MYIHQLVHTLNYGDAISGEAIAIKKVLSRMGVAGEIFVVHAHEKVSDQSIDWNKLVQIINSQLDQGAEVALVLHYSIASPLNEIFASLSQVKRVMIYHNLTPVKWFTGYNARVVTDLRTGRSELPKLLEKADIVLADSEFNRLELIEMGCPGAKVLPLLLDQEKWQIPVNPGIKSVLKSHSKNLLHVGRIAPNKCLEDIIKSFYFYYHKIDPRSRLWLVGSDIDTEIYSFELRRLISELRLKQAVTFVGSVADSELKAFYENSDVYLCMSEHEGFCVPLLEAMHFGLPIIAFNSSAVPETLAEAGLLVGTKSYAQIAELVDLLIKDSALRAKIIQAGYKRVQDFTADNFAQKLQTLLINPLNEPAEQLNKKMQGLVE